MPNMTPADPNGPLMQAWNIYKETADYLNTLSWATKLEHTEGSLWAAFERGFAAAQIESDAPRIAALEQEVAKLTEQLGRKAQKRLEMAPIVVGEYGALIGPLRSVARDLGYALAVHGSLQRDIDVVAVPWVQDAAEPTTLAEAIRAKAEQVSEHTAFWLNDETTDPYDYTRRNPHPFPHGRFAWSIHIAGTGTYIDLSVYSPSDPLRAQLQRTQEALQRAEADLVMVKALLHEPGTDPEAWLDSAMATVSAALVHPGPDGETTVSTTTPLEEASALVEIWRREAILDSPEGGLQQRTLRECATALETVLSSLGTVK